MTIEKIISTCVTTISEMASLQMAARKMQADHVGCLVVTPHNNSDEPIGIVTDRDIVLCLANLGEITSKIKVADVMSKNILILKDDTAIEKAILLMGQKGVRRAPVINDEGGIVGIASTDELFILLANELHILADVMKIQSKPN